MAARGWSGIPEKYDKSNDTRDMKSEMLSYSRERKIERSRFHGGSPQGWKSHLAVGSGAGRGNNCLTI